MIIPPNRQLKACWCQVCIANEITTEIVLSLEKDMMKCAMPYGNLHDWITDYCPIKTMNDSTTRDPFTIFWKDKPLSNSNELEEEYKKFLKADIPLEIEGKDDENI